MQPITVRINEERRDLPAGTVIAGLLQQLELQGAAVAVAVNGRFVPRSTYAEHTLEPGDRIELVAPMAGG
jgi:sulfur carrier protein